MLILTSNWPKFPLLVNRVVLVNRWLMYDNVDPAGELMWLANKLLEVETAGKKAHILAHHPMGNDDCMHMWSSQYRRIVDSRATSVTFTAGSGTPFSLINPNYRVYTIDADSASFRVLDHETWFYNLTEANMGGEGVPPNWQVMYSFNAAYGTSAPFPSEMDALVHRMVNDTALQDQYWRYHEKMGDASLAQGCDATCMQGLMCETVITVQGDTSKCDELYPAP
ncbi:hypothetical protein B566_EDAN009457 [Ephemera danica]|nr:hypothetical protein B566_EDAN009457 [Ephemera danica]